MFASDDPFDFEKPYKSEDIKNRIEGMQSNKTFDPEGFFFLTCRSSAVGCCMVNKTEN